MIANIEDELKKLESQKEYRTLHTLSSAQGTHIRIDGRTFINFSSNDYLSLANDENVKNALIEGIHRYGVGSGASHLMSGHFEAHTELEIALAKYLGQEKVLLFSSGYMANLGILSTLKNELNWILQDRLNHASLLDANQLARLRIKRYAHNDIDALKRKLYRQNGCGLIASDVVFSMDGDCAYVAELSAIAQKENHYLLLDGAHSFTLMDTPINAHSIYMATLGKALGTIGAFVTGDSNIIDYLLQKARPYIYSTAIPPALCLATIASLNIAKNGKRQQRLMDNICYFKILAKDYQLNFLPSNTAIQVLIIGKNAKTLALAHKLQQAGFFIVAIRTPTVAKNSARLRITLNTLHKKSEIKQLLKTLRQLIDKGNYENKHAK